MRHEQNIRIMGTSRKKWVPIPSFFVRGFEMKSRLVGGVLIISVLGILFITGNVYPAIRTNNLEEGIGITDNKTEEMLQELSESKAERGMAGDLTADLEKALWFSSNKETIRARGEVFQDVIGYSEIKDLKTEIRRIKEADVASVVMPASTLILSKPLQNGIKKEITERGLEKKTLAEKGAKEPLFSMLRNSEREEISVPVGEDSALPYTSFLLVTAIVGSIVSFMLTCTWCTWTMPAPNIDLPKRGEDEEDMALAA